MIERGFIAQRTKEFFIKQHIEKKLRNVGISKIRLKKIPLGEKIIILTSRPSLIVGSKGSNIKALTRDLKKIFKLENPQIEINEVKNIFLDANIVAERIAYSLERFGSARFKGIGHKTMANVINAGALGVEIIISGKIPGARAKNWRFYQGYLKKCGDIALTGVRSSHKKALLKSGIIGIKVKIMPPNLVLPDHIEILEEPIQVIEEVEIEKEDQKTAKKTTKKKATKKAKIEEKSAKVETKEESKVEPVVEEKSTSESKTIPEKIEDKVVEVASDVVEAAEEVVSKVTDKVSEVLHLKKKSDEKKKEEDKSEVSEK